MRGIGCYISLSCQLLNVISWITQTDFIMNRFFVFPCVIFSAVMFTAPAYAAESPSYYVSGNVGASWFNDMVPNNGNDQNNPLSTSGGINVMGAFGIKWCDTYRLEAELGYQRNNAKQVIENAVVYDMQGYLSVTSILANGYYDFKVGGVDPYLTAGIGWASVGINDVDKVSTSNLSSESHSVLAYQFGAGVAIPVAKNVAVDARYRYFRTSTVGMNNSNGDFQIGSNSALLGLRVGF